MKNIIRNAELFVVFIVSIGLALRLLEVEMADTILMFGLLTLGFVYLGFGYLMLSTGATYMPVGNPTDPMTGLAKFISGASGMSMSVSAVGICFRMLHWPGWQMMLMNGVIACAICLLAVYLVVRIQHDKLAGFMNYRLAMMIGMSLLLMYSSL